nr:MAG TPA: hypothetical protein [Caudoviricetes sp.]
MHYNSRREDAQEIGLDVFRQFMLFVALLPDIKG